MILRKVTQVVFESNVGPGIVYVMYTFYFEEY